MTTVSAALPITDRVAPHDQHGVADAVRETVSSAEAVLPLGGQTSLDYGLPPSREGIGLDLTGLNRVVDYAARDMTISVEAGVRMADLAKTLAGESQQLPIDVPCPSEATIGGAIATNFSGPRRCGHGTLRDYLIGITAVDGRGITFHGGGRVVKNVAGYDFCKLLVGSLGTLAVITQVTLKVKPLPAARRWLACRLTDWDHAERLLEALVSSATTPAAIELLTGPGWKDCQELASLRDGALTLAVLFEGAPSEVAWQVDRLHNEWGAHGVSGRSTLAVNGAAADNLLRALAEFPHAGILRANSFNRDPTVTAGNNEPTAAVGANDSPLVVKAAVTPSQAVSVMRLVHEIDPEAALQCHAASGVVIARFRNFDAADLTRVLVGRLQSAAIREGGSVTVLRSMFDGLTPQIVWGGRQASHALMESVKAQFDPHNILNPGRFIFH